MSYSRPVLRVVARKGVYPLVELGTLALLVARKTLARNARLPQARSLKATGEQRVLVVAAHPDDETIGCFGAILLHLEAGDAIRVAIVTDGSGSRAGGLSPVEMAARRREEVAQLQLLIPTVEIEQLGLVEGRWNEDELTPGLRQMLEASRPNIVYAPCSVDFHPEHIMVGKTLARVLDEMPRRGQPLVRAYEMQVPLGIELTNLYAPLGTHLAVKRLAIHTYKSQRGALDLWRRQARYLGALYRAGSGAEAFWEMAVEGYRRVMDYAHWDWRTTPFRSLSGRPFGDLRAHLAGRPTRLLLRQLAQD